MGHHSTSDDSSAYRSNEEVEEWTKRDHPIDKFRNYLESKGLWNTEMEQAWHVEAKKSVLEAFARAERKLKPAWTEMFEDVYETMPPNLK